MASADVGFRDQSFQGTGTQVTGAKPESKLWFNDGYWWAIMWDSASADNTIFRREAGTETWVNTGVTVDLRGGTRADALWDGTKLYVASHGYSNSSSAGFDSRLYRYSYNPITQQYSLDLGYPVVINNYRTEALVIDKDSTGKLWATWVQGDTVYVNRTLGDDRTWGTPFPLPATDATGLSLDDIASTVAFGNKVGVMWANQNSARMNFVVHTDGSSDTSWGATEVVNSGPLNADDHINLKADSAGRVYAAIKTEQTAPDAPLVELAVRSASGTWALHEFGTKSDHHTRPIVLLDEERRVVHMFATSGESGGTIYEKTTPMDAIGFAPGLGTPFVAESAAVPDINDATSTKQSVSASTGLVVMASDDTEGFYWHNSKTLGEVALGAAFTGTPTSGDTPLTVNFTDSSTGTPSSWSWDFGDGGTSTGRNPSHTYTAVGAYTVTLTVTDSSGATGTKTRASYVNAQTFDADFTSTTTSGTTPVTVNFTDTTSGTPTQWAWDFGDGSTSTEQNPVHRYTVAGTYTVTLTARNAAGVDSMETKSGYVNVSAPLTQVTLAPSADAYVRSDAATTNTATATTLWVKQGVTDGKFANSYLKFNVTGLAGTVTSARLQLFVASGASNGGTVNSVVDNTWTETGLTWNTAPVIGDKLADVKAGAVTTGETVDVDLPPSAFAAGSGTYTLALKGPSVASGTAKYGSRENATPPQLILASDAPPPSALSAEFSATPTTGDVPLPVSFTDLSAGTPTSWSWDFGDGTTSTQRDPSHTYANAGTYTVKLTVTDATGAASTKTKTDLVVAKGLLAAFSGTPTSGTTPLTVTFSDSSGGSPTAWSWTFGDGGTSTAQNPIHTYTAPGTYTVELTVRNAAGQTRTETKTNYVTVSPPASQVTLAPVADGYVRSLSPTANFGKAATLRVKHGGATGEYYTSFLKFDVSGLSGPVTSAKLRLYVEDPATHGGTIHSVLDNTWTETGLTWKDAPVIEATQAGSLGAVALDTFVEVELPASTFAAGSGTYSLAIKSPGQSGGTAWYSSREGAQGPALILGSG